MDRREFLALLALTFASLEGQNVYGGGKKFSGKSWLLASRAPKFGGNMEFLTPSGKYEAELRIFNPDLTLHDQFPVGIMAHSWIQDPQNPHLIYATTKHELFAGVADLKQRRYLHHLRRPRNVRYWGHGVFSPDNELFLSARDDSRMEGLILRYRGSELVGSFSSEGVNSHGLFPLPNDPTVVIVTNTVVAEKRSVSLNYQPHLAWLDLKTKKIIHKIPSRMNLGPGHILYLDSTGHRFLVLGTNTFPSVEYYDGKTLEFFELAAPIPYLDGVETLNAAVDPTDPNLIWITCPVANLLLQFDLTKKELRIAETLEKARHVFLANGRLYRTYDAKKNGQTVTNEFRENKWRRPDPLVDIGNSSHIDWIQALT